MTYYHTANYIAIIIIIIITIIIIIISSSSSSSSSSSNSSSSIGINICLFTCLFTSFIEIIIICYQCFGTTVLRSVSRTEEKRKDHTK